MAKFSKRGSVTVVELSDPLTLEYLQGLSTQLDDETGGHLPRYVIDLGRTALVDSAGLEFLLDLQELCLSQGGEVTLAAVSPLCQEILRITEVARRFKFFPDATAAVGSFAL